MSEPRTVFEVGPRDAGTRLDAFLKQRIPGLSRARIQRAIRQRVSLSWNVPARSATPVRPGGLVIIAFEPVPEARLAAAIPILARGAGWLAADKPAGMPVHPVHAVRENSLIRVLRRQEGDEGLRLCHRLDRETSGVILVARDGSTARFIAAAFASGTIRKDYLALVAGRTAVDEGTIDLAIGPARGSRVHARLAAVADGRPARTRWRVERRFANRTLVRVVPETGRRHQIRVHLAAIGHPILGDLLYGRTDEAYLQLARGEADPREREGGPRRHLLHAGRIVFPAPTGETVDVVSPLPEDFRSAL